MSPLNITQPLDSIRYMVYNGYYYKVMSNIPKMGHLTTPEICLKTAQQIPARPAAIPARGPWHLGPKHQENHVYLQKLEVLKALIRGETNDLVGAVSRYLPLCCVLFFAPCGSCQSMPKHPRMIRLQKHHRK